MNSAKNKENWGERLYTILLEWSGVKTCLVKSLKASNKGCNNPTKETLLGPNRLWNNPITFRSNKVKKATDNKISKHCTSQETDTNNINTQSGSEENTFSFED